MTDSDLVSRAVRNAHRGHASRARWAHVMDAFAVGSTVARELCERFDLQPDVVVGEGVEEHEDCDTCLYSEGSGACVACYNDDNPERPNWVRR